MKEKLWTKDFLTSAFALFFISLINNIVMTILPIFTKNLSGNDSYVGLMTTVFTASALSVRFLSGKLIERYPIKRIVLLGALVLLGSTALFVNCNNITLAMLARLGQGFGFGIAQTGMTTNITQSAPRSRMMEAVNYASFFNAASTLIGPTIAFSLIGSGHQNFNAAFIFASSLVLIVMVFALSLKARTFTSSEGAVEDDRLETNWFAVITSAVVVFLVAVSSSGVVSFITLFSLTLGISNLSLFFIIQSVGILSTKFIMPQLLKVIKPFTALFFNSLIFFVSIFLLTKATSLTHILLLAYPLGFGAGCAAPIVNGYMVQNMPANKSGTANGIFYSCLDSGFGIGGLIWGLVAASYGYRSMFLMTAYIQILSLVICAWVLLQEKRSASLEFVK